MTEAIKLASKATNEPIKAAYVHTSGKDTENFSHALQAEKDVAKKLRDRVEWSEALKQFADWLTPENLQAKIAELNTWLWALYADFFTIAHEDTWLTGDIMEGVEHIVEADEKWVLHHYLSFVFDGMSFQADVGTDLKDVHLALKSLIDSFRAYVSTLAQELVKKILEERTLSTETVSAVQIATVAVDLDNVKKTIQVADEAVADAKQKAEKTKKEAEKPWVLSRRWKKFTGIFSWEEDPEKAVEEVKKEVGMSLRWIAGLAWSAVGWISALMSFLQKKDATKTSEAGVATSEPVKPSVFTVAKWYVTDAKNRISENLFDRKPIVESSVVPPVVSTLDKTTDTPSSET